MGSRTAPNRLAAAAATLVLACAAAGCGGGAKHGALSLSTSSSTGSSAAPRGGANDEVYLTTYSKDDGPTSTAIVTGGIGDYGQAVTVHTDGTVDPEHRSQLELKLQKGTFRLDIAALDVKLVAAFATFPSNHTTCSGNVVVSQPTSVVAGAGTGAYRTLTGTFSMTVTIAEVDPTKECGSSSGFLAQSVVFVATGHIRGL